MYQAIELEQQKGERSVLHPLVAEAAVVGFPHEIKGGYLRLRDSNERCQSPTSDSALIRELEELVRAEIGPIAKPDKIQWAPGLQKLDRVKIMRRILGK